jgi:hypothetical protein
MTCATVWLQAGLQHDDGVRRLVIIDEAWAVISNQAILFSHGSAAPAASQLRRQPNASRGCLPDAREPLMLAGPSWLGDSR